ncbi:MAG: dephospho-CoA kinase [Gammaproteobacteria bacterium]|nr:MAG: dephospho-CoA kinase [Gammaproteobacteria bacterium]
MFTVGLTGGIACGKTVVSDTFKDLGVNIVDTDIIARDVVEPGTKGLQQVITQFGNEIILPDGTLDRRALRSIVFNNPPLRKKLETILHPLIREESQKRLESGTSAYSILVVPLLFETGMNKMVNQVLAIDTPPEIQLQRLLARDSETEEGAKKIIASQIPREERLKQADDVLLNDGDIITLQKQIEILHNSYLRLAN